MMKRKSGWNVNERGEIRGMVKRVRLRERRVNILVTTWTLEEVADLVREWFRMKTSEANGRWSRDPLGRVIKEGLKGTGNWKNAPRGNPKKGREERIRRALAAGRMPDGEEWKAGDE